MRSSTYNRLERWLHWLALEPQPVRELAFDLERRYAKPTGVPARRGGAVYVCGLARSGTTVLLRALARCEQFRSLTYRDMPFVLAPNLWRLVAGRTNRSPEPAERAHGDGIVVDFDSPEAFEEVFWRTFCPQLAASGCYAPEPPTREAMSAFAEYRAVVAGEKRYLSKNNNNLVRLDALASHGDGAIVVVYRDPVEAARSLHRQHLRFGESQRSSPFVRSYMSWLGHHEFGLDHKPFCFAKPAMTRGLSPEEPDYWLDYWTAVHDHIDRHAPAVLLFDHDQSRLTPSRAFGAVLRALDVDGDPATVANEIRGPGERPRPPDEFAPEILDKALGTHASLRKNANNVTP
jgi:hypothetical protein